MLSFQIVFVMGSDSALEQRIELFAMLKSFVKMWVTLL